MAARISHRLQFAFDHEISSEIRSLKNTIKEKRLTVPGQEEKLAESNTQIIDELATHIQLYDKVCKMKYRLHVMENL